MPLSSSERAASVQVFSVMLIAGGAAEYKSLTSNAYSNINLTLINSNIKLANINLVHYINLVQYKFSLVTIANTISSDNT